MKSKVIRYALFLIFEAILFSMFYLTLWLKNSSIPFYLYIGLFPLFLFLLVYWSENARSKLKTLLVSKDIIIFFIVLSAWIYIYALEKVSIPFVFTTLYFPVLIEELNFRFIIMEYLSEFVARSRAVIIQAIFYTLLYAGYLIFLPGSYPGIYAPMYVIDMLSMGLVYGAIYYIRKNLYIDMSIHLSLWLMAEVIPFLLVWIPYALAPT